MSAERGPIGFVKVYAFFDRKTREHGQLITARNDESMVRLAVDTLQGSGNMMEKYPTDFDMVCVGEFDPESGQLNGDGFGRLVTNLGDILVSRGEREDG